MSDFPGDNYPDLNPFRPLLGMTEKSLTIKSRESEEETSFATCNSNGSNFSTAANHGESSEANRQSNLETGTSGKKKGKSETGLESNSENEVSTSDVKEMKWWQGKFKGVGRKLGPFKESLCISPNIQSNELESLQQLPVRSASEPNNEIGSTLSKKNPVKKVNSSEKSPEPKKSRFHFGKMFFACGISRNDMSELPFREIDGKMFDLATHTEQKMARKKQEKSAEEESFILRKKIDSGDASTLAIATQEDPFSPSGIKKFPQKQGIGRGRIGNPMEKSEGQNGSEKGSKETFFTARERSLKQGTSSTWGGLEAVEDSLEDTAGTVEKSTPESTKNLFSGSGNGSFSKENEDRIGSPVFQTSASWRDDFADLDAEKEEENFLEVSPFEKEEVLGKTRGNLQESVVNIEENGVEKFHKSGGNGENGENESQSEELRQESLGSFQEVSRRRPGSSEELDSVWSFGGDSVSEVETEPEKEGIEGESMGKSGVSFGSLGSKSSGSFSSRPPSHSQFVKGHSRRFLKSTSQGSMVSSTVKNWEKKMKLERAGARAHALSWHPELLSKSSESTTSGTSPPGHLLVLFCTEKEIREEKKKVKEGQFSRESSRPGSPALNPNQSPNSGADLYLELYRQSSPQRRPRSPGRRAVEPLSINLDGQKGEIDGRNGGKIGDKSRVHGFDGVSNWGLEKIMEQAREIQEKKGRVLRRVLSEGQTGELAQSVALFLEKNGKKKSTKLVENKGNEEEVNGLQVEGKTEVKSQLENEEMSAPLENSDANPKSPTETPNLPTEIENSSGTLNQGPNSLEEEEKDSKTEEIPEISSENPQNLSKNEENELQSLTETHIFGPSLEDLGLRANSTVGSSPYPPGRLSHREYGPIAVARSRVQGCREHWSWLFVEFLEELLRGLSGECSGEKPWNEASPPLRISSGRFSRQASNSTSWSTSAALREFDWLERKFKGVESSLLALPPGTIPLVYTSGLACWLMYWERYGDGPPAWTLEDSVHEQTPPLSPRRAELWGPQGSLQQKLMEEALGDRPRDGGCTDDRADFVEMNPGAVLRMVGLAAEMAMWQPATSAVVLVRLLDRLGQYGEDMGESEGRNGGKDWVLGAVQFVVSCIIALLSSCQLSVPDWSKDSPSIDNSWQPPKLSSLAEVALAEGICGANRVSRSRRLQEIDRLYRGGLALNPGLGLLGSTLVAEFRVLGSVPVRAIVDLSLRIQGLGCGETAFQLAVQAVQSGRAEKDEFDDVINITFGSPGGFDPPPVRFTKLAAAVKVGTTLRTIDAPSYVAEFADAMLRSAEQGEKVWKWGEKGGNRAQGSGFRHWVFEVTLSFLKLHSPSPVKGELGGLALSPGLNPRDGDRERELLARATLSRWMEVKGGEQTLNEMDSRTIQLERAAEIVAELDDPEMVLGWPVWVRIGQIVEGWGSSAAVLLTQLRRLAILWTYDKLEEDGTSTDLSLLAAFDWALDGLLRELPEESPGPHLIQVISPHEEEIADVILSVAERMGGRTFSRWAHADETTFFVSTLLQFADEKGYMDEAQFQRAVQVSLRLFGWAMPKPEQLASECQDEEEAREVLERAMVAMWQSVAMKGLMREE